jgi:hypothetical protein
MVAGSSARAREGLERHQWVVEAELYRTFVIFGRRSDYSRVIVQGVAETFLIDKGEVVCPFCPRPCEELVNNPLGNVALENIWLAVFKGEDNTVCVGISPVTRFYQEGCWGRGEVRGGK